MSDRHAPPVPPVPFYYLATPYSRHPRGVEEACREAASAAAACFRAGILVFSPIPHSHAIAVAGDLPGGFEYWQALDHAMIRASAGLIVVKMDGWENSAGVQAEIVIAGNYGKPIHYMRLGGPVPQVRIA